MSKYVLILLLACIDVTLSAQTWTTQVERLSGSGKVKTVKIKPGMHVNMSYLLVNTDSLKISMVYSGTFTGGTLDSIHIRLTEAKTNKVHSSGVKEQFTYPPAFVVRPTATDSTSLSLAYRKVDYMTYQNEKMNGYGEIGEPVILGSILVLFLSPLICYNFNECKLNTDRYKYWALGSTIGLAAGIATPITIGSLNKIRRFQFNESWPSKDVKTWKFK